MQRVPIVPSSTDSARAALGQQGQDTLDEALQRLAREVGPRWLWHVSSTARGGGVAELLSTLLPYVAGAGISVGWLVIDVDDEFVEITKRIHNRLHGGVAPGGLGEEERAVYDETLRAQADAITMHVMPGDIVVLHDPQTIGLAPVLRSLGAAVIWRCHVGADREDDGVREARRFLLPDVEQADLCIFSRRAHGWPQLDGQVAIVAPCIDVASPKNCDLDERAVEDTLREAGLWAADGWMDLTQDDPIPTDARLVVQVSRWDRLKDPEGLIEAFVRHGPTEPSVHLCIAGPEPSGVADDPEATAVLASTRRQWSGLPPEQRRRVHLAALPMEDPTQNALVVNALQRRADVIVQKSLAEGFGLTVTEAMWKARPVVSTRVGGIQDQIDDGVHGLLVGQPDDLRGFGAAIRRVLDEPELAVAMGQAANARVRDRYLPAHHIAAEAAVVARLSAAS